MGRRSDLVTLTVRSLPTAYDPPDDGVSVATPTCCCCCCCCLATVSATSMFLGTEAYYRSTEQPSTHPKRWWLFVLGFLSVVGLPIVLGLAIPDVAGVGVLLAPVLGWLTLVLAGAPKGKAAVILLTTYAIAVPVFALEFGLALVTVFLIELTFPFTMWAAWGIARGRHRDRIGPAGRPMPPWPPGGMPPPPAAAWPDAPPPPHQPPPPPTLS